MKTLFLFITLSTLFSSVKATTGEDDIIGTWLTADKKGHIEIYKANNLFYGKIIWLKEPNDPKTGKPKIDKENPTASKKSQGIMGMNILYNFKFVDNEYTGGKVYDCRDGKMYTGKLWMTNKNTLNMRGYAGIFFSTEAWFRIK